MSPSAEETSQLSPRERSSFDHREHPIRQNRATMTWSTPLLTTGTECDQLEHP